MLADQLVTNMLQRLHVTMVNTNVTSKNVAAVIVTAEAPPFIMEGSKFDVTVSCLGSAASLAGGILLQTPLQGADGQVYATAQGPLLIGGFAAAGAAASVTKNHPTVGRIPDGAILEKRIATVLRPTDDLQIVLNSPDYVTAVRAAQSICAAFPDSATPMDAAVIHVRVPQEYRSAEKLAEFVAKVEEVRVTPDSPAPRRGERADRHHRRRRKRPAQRRGDLARQPDDLDQGDHEYQPAQPRRVGRDADGEVHPDQRPGAEGGRLRH